MRRIEGNGEWKRGEKKEASTSSSVLNHARDVADETGNFLVLSTFLSGCYDIGHFRLLKSN